jgi:hypothetical protein
MVVAYAAEEADFQLVLHHFGLLLGCPSQISRDDLGMYFDALRRILAVPEAQVIVLEAIADGELAEFLESVATVQGDLAENAVALLEAFQTACPSK